MKIVRVLAVAFLLFAALGLAQGGVSAAGVFPGYKSGLSIQNLDAAAATGSMNFYNQDGSLRESVPLSIAGSSVAIYAALPLSTADPFSGSLVVSSDKSLAVIANILNTAGTARASYDGLGSGSSTVSLPLLQKNNGASAWTSWFSVQNAGTGSAQVTVNYPDCSPAAQTPVTIPEGSSYTFDQATEACHTLKAFSATVTSTNPLVAVVMQESLPKSAILAYTGFSSAGSTDLKIPMINIQPGNWTTGIQIFNTSPTTATTLKLTYISAGTPAATCYETQTIPANSSTSYGLGSFTLTPWPSVTTDCNTLVPLKMVGTAYIAAPGDNSAGVPLVAVINETKAITGGLLAGAYTSFASTQGTAQVNFPLIMDRSGGTKWGTSIYVQNVGTATTHIKCTFTGTSVTGQSGTAGVAPNQAFVHVEIGAIAPNYVGAGTCLAYTDNTFTTVDKTAKLVGVFNQVGTGTGDLLLVAEGANVVVP